MSIKKYVKIIQAAGLLTADMSQFDVFLVSGRIQTDPVVTTRVLALGFEPGTVTCVATVEDVTDIVTEMTPQEKVELRSRVSR